MKNDLRSSRVAALAWALSGLCFASAPRAQVDVPATPAGVVLEAWLSSFNSADADRIAQFQRTYARETPVSDVLDWRRETGGYDLVSVEARSPGSLSATLREIEMPDSRITFEVTLTDDEPAKLVSLDVHALPIPRMAEESALAALVGRVDALTRQDRFSGAVLIARNGVTLLERAWGFSDRAAQEPNTVDTRFRLGSMNKIITAVAVLQLVEAGKLSLDTPIVSYLKDYPNREAADKVTLRHLLTHRSGVGEIGFNDSPEFKTTAEFIARRDAMKAPADYLRQYADRDLEFEPGSRTAYSSLGFMILGRLIEQVSGEDYYTYVQKHIHDVAGMDSTGSLPETTVVEGRAVGYTQRDESWVPNDDTLPFRGTPAGGGYSTVGDLRRFAHALQSGKLLSPRMLAEATKLQSGWQGFGFEVLGEGALRSYGHGGMAPGMNAHFRVFPQSGYVIIVLSNFDPPAAGLVQSFFQDRMPLVP